jgi:hypothetical protein
VALAGERGVLDSARRLQKRRIFAFEQFGGGLLSLGKKPRIQVAAKPALLNTRGGPVVAASTDGNERPGEVLGSANEGSATLPLRRIERFSLHLQVDDHIATLQKRG